MKRCLKKHLKTLLGGKISKALVWIFSKGFRRLFQVLGILTCFNMYLNTALATTQCHFLLSSSFSSDTRNLNLRKLLMGDSLPLGAQRLNRPNDDMDLFMILESYTTFSGTQNKPIEIGLIEFLNSEGEVLIKQKIFGSHDEISGINSAVYDILEDALPFHREIQTVRIRHTHPSPLDDPSGYSDDDYSDADLIADRLLRELIDELGLERIKLESWIIYIKDYDGIKNLTDITPDRIRTKGYIVE